MNTLMLVHKIWVLGINSFQTEQILFVCYFSAKTNFCSSCQGLLGCDAMSCCGRIL